MRLPRPGESRAVLFGTSRFDDPGLSELPAVANNISRLENLLTSPYATGLDAGSCVCSIDAGGGDIGRRISEAASEADDLLLVYYAGHGLIDRDGDLFLASPETSPEPALIEFTAMPFRSIRRLVANARAANRVIILDCCFSGRALTAMSGDESLIAGQVSVDGTYTLTSSGANEKSVAPLGAEYTAFSGEFIRILKDGIDGGPELLTLQVIYEQLRMTMIGKGLPSPWQFNTQTVSGLALARNPGYRTVNSPTMLVHEALRLEALGDNTGTMRLLRDAANAGHPGAMSLLANRLDASGDTAQARSWRRKAAESGNVAEMMWHGYHFWDLGDLGEARQWFQRAADAGLTDAKALLRALDQATGTDGDDLTRR